MIGESSVGVQLQQGDHFPSVSFKFAGGETITFPDDIPTRYAVVLFYRGHWWPQCVRQLAEWEAQKEVLAALGCSVYAISVATREEAQGVVDTGITFPIGYGCTKEDAETIGAWWGNHPPQGEHIQPTEFLLRQGGIVLGSMYASGSVGRMGAEQAVNSLTNREKRRKKGLPPSINLFWVLGILTLWSGCISSAYKYR